MMLPHFVEDIIKKISDSGFQAFVVGGSVRDLLCGKKPVDWDITTSATPTEIMEIFSDERIIPTGIEHGTVTLIAKGIPVEITTYRIDGDYKDCRHPQSVIFSANVEEDLKRRDFTINSMAYNEEAGLIDPFGGRKDLEDRLIRCVGEPKQRFKEDALRIMRALRFSAALGFDIEASTKDAVFASSELLKNISAERISAELSKLLEADTPQKVLAEYKAVFEEIFGVKLEKTLWEEVVEAVSLAERDASTRLSLLICGVAWEDAVNILKKLRYDNKTQKETKLLCDYQKIKLPTDPYLVKKEIFKIGEEAFLKVLGAKRTYKKALGVKDRELEETERVFNNIIHESQCCSFKQLAVKGEDVKKQFGVQGKAVGDILRALLDAVMLEKCRNQNSELIKYARENIFNKA